MINNVIRLNILVLQWDQSKGLALINSINVGVIFDVSLLLFINFVACLYTNML